MKDLLKNKKKMTIIITIISILLVGSAIATSTYALFYDEKVAANPNEYSTGLLSIEAISKSDTISLNNALPMEDSEGIETDAYIFTIKNNGNLDYTFDVKLLSTNANTINPNYIKLKIDDAPVTTLSSLTNSTIKSNLTLNAKETIDISIKIWLDINTPNTEIGKTFTSKLVIDGQAVYTETNYSVSPETVITSLFTPNSTVTEDPSGDAIVLDVDTIHSLVKDPRGNIRYYGANPNNYIKFNCDTYPDTNCETWRIIGVVDGKVKIIRNSIIGTFSWDTSENTTVGNSGNGINQWGESTYTTDGTAYKGADLMKLLNPGYENESINNSLYYNSDSGTCYNGKSNASTTTGCNFTSSGVQGIKNTATRNKIAETTFYTGGWNSNSIYPNVILEKERLTGVGSNTYDKITRTTTWTGRVAVPYPSDYGYAADLSLCTGKDLFQYNDSTCTANNWMKNIITKNGIKIGWLLTPYSGTAYHAWLVNSSGNVYGNLYAYFANGVVPVLYLSSNEIIESGSGTNDNPYTLAA